MAADGATTTGCLPGARRRTGRCQPLPGDAGPGSTTRGWHWAAYFGRCRTSARGEMTTEITPRRHRHLWPFRRHAQPGGCGSARQKSTVRSKSLDEGGRIRDRPAVAATGDASDAAVLFVKSVRGLSRRSFDRPYPRPSGDSAPRRVMCRLGPGDGHPAPRAGKVAELAVRSVGMASQ